MQELGISKSTVMFNVNLFKLVPKYPFNVNLFKLVPKYPFNVNLFKLVPKHPKLKNSSFSLNNSEHFYSC